MAGDPADNPFATPEAQAGAVLETKPPYSPRAIGWITFFFSWLVGGILLGINYERLGQPEKKISTIAMTIVGFIVFIVVVSFLPDGSVFDRIGNWVNIGFSVAFAQMQKQLYEAHVGRGGQTSSPWPLVGLLLAGALVLIGAAVGVFMVLPEG